MDVFTRPFCGQQVYVERQPQPPSTKDADIKKYIIPITSDIQMTFVGQVEVYAACEAEAIAKVQAQVDTERLDEDLKMEDADSSYTMPYKDVTRWLGSLVEIVESDIEIDDDEVDPGDVLGAEIEQLQASISWNTDALARHKAFLNRS